MKILIAAALAATTFLTTPALAADVGVSVTIGQPGFYGRLDIGDYPQPQVIYRQPRIVERVQIERPPIYMHVPPGHAKNWKKYCRKYDACGEQVYFVKDNWYNREYVPRYQERQRDRREGGRDERKDDQRGDQRKDRQDGDHDRGRNH